MKKFVLLLMLMCLLPLCALGEGREAVNPFYPEYKPVDAYCALILDRIYLR